MSPSRRVEVNSTLRSRGADRPTAAPVVVEGALPQPLLAGSGRSTSTVVRRGRRGSVPSPRAVADLVDHRLAVPREVGARLAQPGRGEEVRREAAADADRASSCGPRAGDGDGEPEMLDSTVAPARAALALGGTGTHSPRRSRRAAPARDVACREQQVVPERHLARRRAGSDTGLVLARGELAGARRTRGSSAGALGRDAEDRPRWITTAQL